MKLTSLEPIYAQALNLAKNVKATASNIERVAKLTSVEAARWAFGQWALRAKGAEKFAFAHQMLFDREGLEMATHEGLSSYHASLFPQGALVHDLTAGLGSDLIAMSRRGPVVGFELDPDRTAMAQHNLAIHGSSAEIHAASFESAGEVAYFFADPARRAEGNRTLDPNDFSPNPKAILNLFGSCRLGVFKLSPMLNDNYLEAFGGRLEFVSFRGECREALAIVGAEAGNGRFAVLAESRERIEVTSEFVPSAESPDSHLYEADPAAVRAHALATLAVGKNLHLLADSNGYLTGGEIHPTPWLKPYKVLTSGSFNLSDIKKDLTALDASTPVLKQRGAGHDLDFLRRKLSRRGSRHVQIAFYVAVKSQRYAILENLR